MANTASGNVAAVNDLVEAFRIVCAADGWTVDYSTTGRIHIHKGSYHFEIYAYTSNNLGIVGCTGYTSGQTPPNQPGASGILQTHVIASSTTNYQIISTGSNVICLLYRLYGPAINSCAFGTISEKIGSWSGGQFVLGGSSYYSTNCDIWSTVSAGVLMMDGAWAPNASFGSLCGLFGTTVNLRSRMPNTYNAGILRLPITVYLRNLTTPTLYHPIGYAPNIYQANGADVYMIGETIQVNGEDHLFAGSVPGISTVANLLIKMEA